MFIDEEFFVNATLFSFSSESRHRSVNITVATYQLTYQNVEIVSNSYITAQFDDNYVSVVQIYECLFALRCDHTETTFGDILRVWVYLIMTSHLDFIIR